MSVPISAIMIILLSNILYSVVIKPFSYILKKILNLMSPKCYFSTHIPLREQLHNTFDLSSLCPETGNGQLGLIGIINKS